MSETEPAQVSPNPRPFAAHLALAAASYLAFAELGHLLSIRPGEFDTYWPASGLYLAVLLKTAYRRWPALVAILLAANLFADVFLQGRGLSVALGFSLANAAEALVGASLFRLWFGEPSGLRHLGHFLGLVVISILVSTPLGATIGSLTLRVTQGTPLVDTWDVWWIADALGVLIVAPPLLLWPERGRSRERGLVLSHPRVLEGLGLIVLLGIATEVAFASPIRFAHSPVLLFPFLLWAALRLGVWGVSAALLTMTIVVLPHLRRGDVVFLGVTSLEERDLMMQVFLAVGASMGHALAIIMDERRSAEERLRDLNASLEDRVRERTAELTLASRHLHDWRERYEATIRSSGHLLYDRDRISGLMALTGDCSRFFDEASRSRPIAAEEWLERIHPDDRAAFESARRESDREAVPFRLEYRLRGGDHTYRIVQDDAYPVRDAQGDATRAIGFVKDVTESRTAQQELLYQTRLLRTITDNAPSMLLMLDTKGRTTFVNPAVEQITGFSAEELVGRVMYETLHSPRAEGPAFPFLSLSASQSSRAFEDWFLRKDGTAFPVRCTVSPILRGEVLVGTLIEAQDITELDRATRRLVESEERFRLAAEAVNGIIYEFEASTGLVHRTRGLLEILGYRPEEVPSTVDWWIEQVHPDDREPLIRRTATVLASSDRCVSEYRVRHRDGRYLHVMDRVLVLRDPDGTVTRHVGCSQDISEIRRAEAAVLESESKFRGLFESNVVPLKFWHVDGRILDANDAYLQLVGYDRDELERGELRWDRLAAPEELERERAAIEEMRRTGRCTPFEKEMSLRDGRRLPVLIGGSTLPGATDRGVGFVIDLTERRRTEKALQMAEERFRVAQESSLYGFMILRAVRDDQGAIGDFVWEYANPVAARTIGLAPESAVGRRLLEHQPEVRSHYDLFDRYVRVVETGQPHDIEVYLDSDRMRGWFRNMTVKSGDGVAVSFADITDRKRLEAELRRKVDELAESDQRKGELLQSLRQGEEQFRTLADSIPQLAWMARPDGSIFWFNRRWHEYAGTSPEEMEGWGWQSVHDPDELPRVLESYRSAILSAQPWEDTFPIRRHDGVMRWHLSRALPVRDDEGRIVRWFGTNTDITDRMEMEEALREDDRRKDEFLATLAHELRNPLAPIRTSLEILRRSDGNPEDQAQARATMERQLLQMVRLIDDLLDISRITRNKLELRTQRIELAALVHSALETSRPLIERGDHRLTVSLPDEPIWLDGDLTRLAQVFSNLLNNAAKYTEPGGLIELDAARCGDEVLVSVRDNGIGIPAEMLPQVFEMFTQVDRSRDRADGGLGIGLTLVRRLVEMHGGTVEAQSDGPGLGSTFLVRLPVLDAEPVAPASPTDNRDVAAANSSRRVLVVDDSPDSLRTLSRLLRLIGHEVRTACDGQEAVEQADRFRPDVILLDIGLPRLNGYEAARAIREFDWAEDVQILALTGWGQEDDRRKSSEAGFDHHLVKPVDPDLLIRLVGQAGTATLR